MSIHTNPMAQLAAQERHAHLQRLQHMSGATYVWDDLTQNHLDCVRVVKGKMTSRQIALASGKTVNETTNFLLCLFNKGYLNRGWRQGKRTWWRTDKEVPQ